VDPNCVGATEIVHRKAWSTRSANRHLPKLYQVLPESFF
jgi:hypothetical protein